MAEIGNEAAKNIVGKLIDYIIGESRYICCFKSIVDDFEKEKSNLKAKWTTVNEEVKYTRDNAQDIQNLVVHWQEQAESLIKEDTNTKMTCFWGWCPNCIWRYHRGKELAQKAVDIKTLNQTEFPSYGHPPRLQGIEAHSSGFIHFESRGLAYNKLLLALADDNNYYMIGLHGMGGAGKTTLAKEVGTKLRELKKFDNVIFTTVSNSPDIIKIQDSIAGPLRLILKDKNEWERRNFLWKRLTDGEKTLIILDDLWDHIDFEEIGIPSRDDHKNCRVLITTRDAGVCSSMGCLKLIQLGLLPEQDAWILFKKYAGIDDNSATYMKVKGPEITKKCKGLPVAVVAIASTVKDRPIEEWNAALIALQNHKNMDDVPEDLKDIYTCLRYSYDNMKNEKAKGLFLLMSMFPEDEEVPLEILTRYGIGVGLFGEVDKYCEARNQVLIARNKLIDSCLLLKVDEVHVKMHDLVRDVALWIAKKEIQLIALPDKTLKALTEKKKGVKYLLCDNMQVGDMGLFPSWLDGSKLEILQIRMDEISDSVKIPNDFFEKFTTLRVLSLSQGDSEMFPLPLPLSVPSLISIRSLIFDGWKLGDISIFGTLKSLETLDLEYCLMSELPNNFTELEKLRLLRLVQCKFKRNPFEVIERCSSLEELYFLDRRHSILMNVYEAWKIPQNKTFPALNRYLLGKQEIDAVSISKFVCLPCIDTLISEAMFKDFVLRTEILRLERIQGAWRNLIPEIVVPIEDGCMNDLVELSLESCSNFQCLINTQHIPSFLLHVFSKLVALKLKRMDNLEELCSGPFRFELLKSLERLVIKQCGNLQGILFNNKFNLSNLKIIKLEDCSMLVSLFLPHTAQSLVVLEELRIYNCKKLTNIISIERSHQEDNGGVDGHNGHQSCDSMFPNLKTIEIERCQRLECILRDILFPQDVPRLETIKIVDCHEMKYIFGRYQHEEQALCQQIKDVIPGSLKNVKLSGLTNFINVFVECHHPMSSLVKKKSPSSMKRLLSRNGSKAKEQDHENYIVFLRQLICCNDHKYKPKLRDATSVKMPVISATECSTSLIANSPQHVESAQCLSKTLQGLNILLMRNIELNDVKKTNFLFDLSTASSMMLENLKIGRCDELKHIVDIGNDHNGKSSDSVFPNLKTLSVDHCDQLKHMFGQYSQDHQNYEEIHVHVPILEALTLNGLPNFTSIWAKNSLFIMLSSLKKIEVNNCPLFAVDELYPTRQMYSTSTEILHSECSPLGESSHECLSKQSQGLNILNICNIRKMDLKGVEKINFLFVLSVASLLVMLEDLRIGKCHELKHIVDFENVYNGKSSDSVFPNLKTLDVDHCDQLEHIFGQYPQDHQSFEEIRILLPKLETLRLCYLPNFTSIYAKNSLSISLPSLMEFKVEECPLFAVASISDSKVDFNTRQVSCTLMEISNSECSPCVESEPSQGLNMLIMRNITWIELTGVQKINSLFVLSTAALLVMLEYLKIKECHGLKHIVDIVNDQDGKSLDSVFPNLKRLSVLNCDQLQHMIAPYRQDHLHIHFPRLESLYLACLPHFTSICAQNSLSITFPYLRFFQMIECPLLAVASISDFIVDFDTRRAECTLMKDMREIEKIFLNLKILVIKNSKVENIFCLNGLQMMGQQIGSGIQYMELKNLPEMMNICAGSKTCFTFQNLSTLRIEGCEKLEVVFHASVLKCLPKLQYLGIKNCKELKQIIEMDVENEKFLSADLLVRPCFPKLGVLVIEQCHKLKHLMHSFPNLEVLMINGANALEKLGCDPPSAGQQGGEIEKTQTEFPKLKIIIFMHLSSLRQRIELSRVWHRFILDCPRLISLTSTTTLGELWDKIDRMKEEEDLEISDKSKYYFKLSFDKMMEEVNSENRKLVEEATTGNPEDPQVQRALGRDLPSSQNIEAEHDNQNNNDINLDVSSFATAPSLRQELVDGQYSLIEPCVMNKREAVGCTASTKDIPAQDFVDEQSINEPCLRDQQKSHSHGETESITDIPNSNEKILKESIQEGSEAMEANLLPGAESFNLSSVAPSRTESSGWDMLVSDSRIVEQDEKLNKGATRVLSCQNTQDGIASIQKGSNLKQGEKCGISNDSIEDILDLEINRISQHMSLKATKDNAEDLNVQRASGSDLPSSSHVSGNQSVQANIAEHYQNNYVINLDVSSIAGSNLREELVDGQSMKNIPYLMNKMEALGETAITTDIPQSTKIGVERGTSSNSDKAVSPSSPLVTSQCKSYPHSKIRLSETENYTDKENEDHSINNQDLGDDDLINLFQPLEEEDGDGQIPTKDNLLMKVLADLEEFTKMPLKEIACNEANSLPLLTALKFLSQLPLEDVTLSEGLKPIINSLHQEFPKILCSFKQALAITNKYAALEKNQKSIKEELAHRNTEASTLVSKISKAKKSMDETLQKKAILKEQTIMLEKEMKDYESDLEESLKVPLKEIASNEANSLHLLTALNFLSQHSLEDVTLSDRLKSIIDSLQQEFPNILCSFKQALATTNKFSALEEKEKSIKEELARRNEEAITLVSKISKAKKSMDEALQKEAILNEQIIMLEKEIKLNEFDLSSLQKEKNKFVAEISGYKKEYETLRKDKTHMMEQQEKARKELFEVNYKWSALISQFENRLIAARNPS